MKTNGINKIRNGIVLLRYHSHTMLDLACKRSTSEKDIILKDLENQKIGDFK